MMNLKRMKNGVEVWDFWAVLSSSALSRALFLCPVRAVSLALESSSLALSAFLSTRIGCFCVDVLERVNDETWVEMKKSLDRFSF